MKLSSGFKAWVWTSSRLHNFLANTFKRRILPYLFSSAGRRRASPLTKLTYDIKELLKKLEILPLYSQYIFSISIFVIKNKHLFYTNNQTHSIHTRFKTDLHPPTANLTKLQKAVYYSAIKIFNNLPHNIKDSANETVLFWNASKTFLLINSFYNSKEYFNYQRYSIENWTDNWF